jgi:hypothetical protein
LAFFQEDAGHQAVARQNSPLFAITMSESYEMASTWSERHAAYVGYLRAWAYDDHHAYCLHYSEGICGTCIGSLQV